MKNIINLFILILLLTSCNPSKSKYENIIAETVETSGATRYDLNFKSNEIQEMEQITVADSIKIITDAFSTDKQTRIEDLEKSIKNTIERLDKEKAKRISSKTMILSYENSIDKLNGFLDEVNASRPELGKYETMDEATVLAVVVRCNYSIDEPISKTRVSETFDFILSPDGDRYYGKKGVK